MTEKPQTIDTVTWKGQLIALPDTFELLHYHQIDLVEALTPKALRYATHH